MTKTKTKTRYAIRHKITASTCYTINDAGEGTIVSSARNLDAVVDTVAQHIGCPIQHGDWLESDVSEDENEGTMYVDFCIADHDFESWKALQ